MGSIGASEPTKSMPEMPMTSRALGHHDRLPIEPAKTGAVIEHVQRLVSADPGCPSRRISPAVLRVVGAILQARQNRQDG